jgi:ubiquinone/menaquinone biosynthesis C-methylase UbiE
MMAPGEPDPAVLGGVRPGQAALDAAGGRGRAAAALAAAGARVVLLDRDAGALAEVDPSLAGRVRRVRGDVLSLPFGAATFDAVVLRAVLHHLVEPAAALREAARVTRPGGVVVLVDKAAPEEIERRALRNAVERLRHRGHVWSHSERELRNLAGAARLDVEAWESWTEERDAAEWIARGDCPLPWDGVVREVLAADARAGGAALGARPGPGGGLLLEERWAALRLRKPAGGGR